MTRTVTADDATGVVTVKIDGDLDAEEVRDALVDVWQMPEFWRVARVLWDLRSCVATALDSGALQGIARFESEGRPELPPARLAFLAGRDMEFGLARMFGVFSEDDRLEQQVFRDHDAAWSWLTAQ